MGVLRSTQSMQAEVEEMRAALLHGHGAGGRPVAPSAGDADVKRAAGGDGARRGRAPSASRAASPSSGSPSSTACSGTATPCASPSRPKVSSKSSSPPHLLPFTCSITSFALFGCFASVSPTCGPRSPHVSQSPGHLCQYIPRIFIILYTSAKKANMKKQKRSCLA